MAGNKSLVLLDYLVSPFAQRCRIALAEKKIPCEFIEQEIFGAKSELLLRSNPVYKKVPVLLHDGRPVSESLVILDYLEDAFPDSPPLLPADPYARAQAWFWAAYSDKIYEAGTRLWKLPGEAAHAQARADMAEALRTLERELGEKPFFGGEAFGFVDVAVVPFARRYERLGGFSVEEVAPGLAAWARRCGERESVAGNLQPEEKVDQFFSRLKKHFGVV
ncbi:hypothetical protein QOZ80_6BG0496980 [Eleusine coracana subsp. coracana]|nr:hypothetical protein QOZ80_6BG0496980 [Eleusine coracana subsp. coracana]